ncbi:hypothetical protein [Roseomonas indoligenes]|uniref:Uncharacterized protein n=1 Tax=Roseomonas indoligenes TaxID=2820811 RepID=A0A940MWA2_9PROT|nr:hypothetical protein [Pararoseomonas indoligenes]MBP0493221.1 hypothetical protein [Pararoseomonas indoligenes]
MMVIDDWYDRMGVPGELAWQAMPYMGTPVARDAGGKAWHGTARRGNATVLRVREVRLRAIWRRAGLVPAAVRPGTA